MLGDVNCDAATNVIDGLFVLQYDVGLRAAGNQCPPPTGSLYTPVCDVNHDSNCNVIDGLFILQCDVGIHNAFCPASALSLQLEGESAEGRGPDAVQVTTLHVGSGEVAPGGSISVPVTADLGGDLLGAGTVEIRYDPAVLDATGCSVDPEGRFDYKYCNANYNNDGVNPDSVRLNLTSLAGVTGQLTLANITFQAVGSAGSASNLDVVPVVLSDPEGAALTVSDNYGQVCVTPCGPPIPIATAIATVAPVQSDDDHPAQHPGPGRIARRVGDGQHDLHLQPDHLAHRDHGQLRDGGPLVHPGGDGCQRPAGDDLQQPLHPHAQLLGRGLAGRRHPRRGEPEPLLLERKRLGRHPAVHRLLPGHGQQPHHGGAGSPDRVRAVGESLAAPAVTASQATGGIELRWTQTQAGIVRYEVYRGTSPYFTGGTRLTPDVVAPGLSNPASVTDAASPRRPRTLLPASWRSAPGRRSRRRQTGPARSTSR